MKTELTIEESARLIELGVGPKLASGTYVGRWEHYSTGSYPDPDSIEPIFKLTDILAILPKEIDDKMLSMEWDSEFKKWGVGYNCLHLEITPELIDALYQLLIWCINNGHYNSKNNDKEKQTS